MIEDGFFGFLDTVGMDAVDGQQQRSIRKLELQAEFARIAQDGNADAIANVARRMEAMASDLAALRVVVEVLAHAVVDLGGVDGAQLDDRMKAALGRFAAAQPQRGVVCGNCGLSYAPSKIVDTDAGPRCKRCHAL
ncbi:MAG: hypothetical protein H6708_31675 [Kofleriaceae bacterium]|nr:hypothetical protein [Myxococcales bacterium]MCB9564968.1 hypothetical protein [Kofleriaceae bacterium]